MDITYKNLQLLTKTCRNWLKVESDGLPPLYVCLVIQQNPTRQTKQYYDEDGKLIIKPYVLKDFAIIYDVSPRTIKRWIAILIPEIERDSARYFNVQEVTKIIEAFGIPKSAR